LFKSNNSDFDKYGKVRKMPHSHGHGGHSHGGKKDIWTKWNQVGEYFDALGTAYFFIGTVDNIKDLIEFAMGTYDPENESDAYVYTLTAVSFALAMVLAYGAAYCHGILNQQYQDPEPGNEESEVENHEHHEREYHQLNSEEKTEHSAAAALEPELPAEHHEDLPLTSEEKAEAGPAAAAGSDHPDEEPSEPPVLTNMQKMLLTADGICHGASKAGSFMGLAHGSLFFAAPSISNSPGVRVGLQAVGTFFGVGAAVAEVRTCKKSLLNHNKEQARVEAHHVSHRHST
jgi:hypothetical protein